MKRILLPVLTILVLILTGCAATEPNRLVLQSGSSGNFQPQRAQDEIALGKVVYALNCASCHGEMLEGEANWKQENEDGSFRSPPHTADGHTWHHADNVLIEAIEKGGARFEGMNIGGSSNMPAFAETLTDEEILAVIEYIKSTWPEDVQEIQRQQTMQTPSS